MWITGSGTCIEVMATRRRPSRKGVAGGAVDAEQGDDVAGPAESMSSISSACMRTMRPTRMSLLMRLLKIVSPFFRVP